MRRPVALALTCLAPLLLPGCLLPLDECKDMAVVLRPGGLLTCYPGATLRVTRTADGADLATCSCSAVRP